MVQGKNYKGPRYFCDASSLTEDDINSFFNHLYSGSITEQDNYLLQMMNVHSASRRKATTSRNRPVCVKYYLPDVHGNKVRVCTAAFLSASCVSSDRIQRVARHHVANGGKWFPSYRYSEVQAEISQSVKDHISSFKCRESHYGCAKSVRKYLPPELNLKMMYRIWSSDRRRCGKPVCQYEKYRQIFSSCFILGFGNPREDICSYCEAMKLKVKAAKVANEKQKLMTEYRLHKMKAKKFYQISYLRQRTTMK